MYPATIPEMAKTIMVSFITSCFLGQVTLESSNFTSLKNETIGLTREILSHLSGNLNRGCQGGL